MALVDYPSSQSEDDSDGQQAQQRPLKRKRSIPKTQLPPLPPSFHDLYASNTRVATSDDPSLHAGRKRHIPHVEGNWPTHVYLEWHPTPTESDSLSKLVKAASPNDSQIHTLILSDLSSPLPLHISLSRSLVLQTKHCEPFLTRVTQNIRAASVRPFRVDVASVAWHSNHDKTRWFLTLSAARPQRDELNRLLDACNRTAKDAQQPTLYASDAAAPSPEAVKKGKQKMQAARDASPASRDIPDCSDSFHISLAWSLSPPPAYTLSQKLAEEHLTQLSICFDSVKVKIGNSVTAIGLLAKAAAARKGILG